MRYYFLDSSALLKLYALEPGSVWVRNMFRSAIARSPDCRIVVCELVHPEAASALRQILDGPNPASRGLSRTSGERAFLTMQSDLGPGSRLVQLGTTGLTQRAAELVWQHRIKGADAVHLAAALFVRAAVRGWYDFYFVGSDRRLNAAATAEGLDVLDPTV